MRVGFVVAISAAILATACSAATPPATAIPSPRPTPSSTPQSTDLLAGVTVSASDVQAADSGGNAFTIDLLKQLELSKPGGNFVDSAYSLSTALAMLQLGARGHTATQIAAVLHSAGATAEQQAAAWKQFDATLLSTAQGDGIALNVANAIWLQQGMPVNAAFLATLLSEFSAPSSRPDFQGDAQGAADLINRWVNDATQGKIPTLVTAQDVSGLKFVLADAIYFDAKWKTQFDAAATSSGPFYRPDSSHVSTPLMHSNFLTVPTYIGSDVTAIEMPYVGGHYAADIIMPTTQPIATFTGGLSPDALAAIQQKMAATPYVLFTLPKFDVSSDLSLQPTLEALGMTDAFSSSSADFTGIDGQRDLFIGLAKQKARMQVDEIGTTATAATAIGGLGGAGPPVPITNVVIDHPFLFLIRDVTTGAIIFSAQVTDPTASS